MTVAQMDIKPNCSEPVLSSLLIRRFVDRAGLGAGISPEQVMTSLATRVRSESRRAGATEQQMQCVLKKRNIRAIHAVRDLHCDGLIEPVGHDFKSGFRVFLKNQRNVARLRFTLAHEICHTFFYEIVPEIKFSPHEIDPMEERLCDLGAAELLMPAASIRRAVRSAPVCLESLLRLAGDYAVSLSAMFLRLRSLRLWRCELSEWHHMINGTFALTSLYGGKFQRWEWDDKSILNSVWNSNKRVFGHTFIKFEDSCGVTRFRPTQYEVGRFGSRMLALWGSSIEAPTRVYPLFEALQTKESRVTRGSQIANSQMLSLANGSAYPLTR